MSDQNAARDWKDTILLPETEFPMRAGLAQREPDAIARWTSADLYRKAVAARAGRPRFVFHDGPPYANGNIHHGHALNKILKDVVVKFRWLDGQQAVNVPGWDCHGLPIEQKVDEQLGAKKRELSEVEFRRHCREYADGFVGVQSEQFRRLMVLADFDRPYRTMDYSYESTIVRELGRFMERGYVYRGLKPVHWSWSAVTALADAEVEYAPYDAPSIYVRFELPEPPAFLAAAAGGRSVGVVIWTTTPWTLPSNLAVALNPGFTYELLALDEGRAIVVAEGLKASVLAACRVEGEPAVLASFEGSQLVGTDEHDCPRHVARHPFLDRTSLLVPADYVTLEQGTGCVHTAPGHGMDDFRTGLKFELETLSPVDDRGCYTGQVPDYEGQHVFKANPQIVQRLADSGHLLNRVGDTYRVDRYPHCWRTNKPLIFRATSQWFIRVDHEDLRQRSLEAISGTRWIPHWGENRIRGMMEVRPDWCISRQRAWGVPITAFTCTACGGDVVDHRVAERVAELVAERGADVWFEEPVEALVPAGTACPHCGAGPDRFDKVRDILDVWFDSGVSWAAVLRDREGLDGQADLYLEGSDQHRGWFHTSLLTAVATTGKAPYRSVLTHGFVVDDAGRKYSKSSPNFEPLDRMIDQHGAEVLRAWVSAVDYRQDMVLAPTLLKQVSDAYRKVRNTMRFLLGNLRDFDPDTMPLQEGDLTPIDRWALRRLKAFVDGAHAAFDNYEFHAVWHGLMDFCNADMSAVYLDALKDRMYCDRADSPARRASQAVMYETLRALVTVAWPILSFTSEEAWSMMPRRSGDAEFVALLDWPSITCPADNAEDARFADWLALRARVQGLIEERRPRKKGEKLPGQIGSSQEAVVTLTVPGDTLARWQAERDTLRELFIVADVLVSPGASSDVDVAVEPASTQRCPRCWNHRDDLGTDPNHPELCGRCASVVEPTA
mgnify:CR=1 FL=1